MLLNRAEDAHLSRKFCLMRSTLLARLDFDEEGNEIFLLTLYREGPVTKNGYTTIRILPDDQGGRDFAVMDTNGIIRDDLSDLAGILIQ
jgi:hypothetical protein